MAQFGDLSDFLKKHCHSNLYKKANAGEGLSNIETRLIKMNKHRRSNRHDAIFEKRQIPANMSPVVTPVQSPSVKRKKTPVKVPVQQQPKPQVNKRFEMMLKWKAERDKKKEAQKRSSKPVFKVSCVSVNVGLPNLEAVNKEIKGKPFKSKFAPVNHQFKPPSNIKPIYFHNSTTLTKQEKSGNKKISAPAIQSRMVTRSQTNSSIRSNNSEIKSTKTPKVKSAQKQTSKILNNSKANTTETRRTPKSQSSTQKEEKTPIRKENKSTEILRPPTYVSPFVTVSRSKESARKEFEARRSGKSFSVKSDHDVSSSPTAGAAYFRWLLMNQISRLQGICDEWNRYKDDPNLPEEATSMIDVAIGQTNLLLTKKFLQFQGLIDKCQEGNTETPVTCEDLHGFWDMIHLQVDNVDKRFENLNNLKANNWEEILPEIKTVVKKKGKTKKNVKASASLRAAIQAARKKKLETNEEVEEVDEKRRTPKNRYSTQLSTLKSQEKNQTNISPGLMMMKVAQYAKTVETPGKSILRSSCKSAKSQTKTVFFKDMTDNEENDLNTCNSANKGKTPNRRSGRLTRSKLF